MTENDARTLLRDWRRISEGSPCSGLGNASFGEAKSANWLRYAFPLELPQFGGVSRA
jgi:hypothetical protein